MLGLLFGYARIQGAIPAQRKPKACRRCEALPVAYL